MVRLLFFVFITMSFSIPTNSYAFWVLGSGTDHGDLTDNAVSVQNIYSLRSETYKKNGKISFGATNFLSARLGILSENVDGELPGFSWLSLTAGDVARLDVKIINDDEEFETLTKKNKITKKIPLFHCDDNKINYCSDYIWNTRRKIGEMLQRLISDPSNIKFDSIIRTTHELFGYSTHTVQDFYSHSNWIEREEFGKSGELRFTWGNVSDNLTDDEKSNERILTDHAKKNNASKNYITSSKLINKTSLINTIKQSTCRSEKDATNLFLSQLASGWYDERPLNFYPITCSQEAVDLNLCTLGQPLAYPLSYNAPYYPNRGKSEIYIPKSGKNEKEYCSHGNTFEGLGLGLGLQFGIHKDSTNRHLHEGAANTAIQATTEYLRAILEDVVTEAQQSGLPDEYIDYVILKFLGHDVDRPKTPICEGANCDATDPLIKSAHHVGDPHIKTFDEFGFDLQIHGEVILVKSSADDTNNLEIQARSQRWHNRNDVSVNTAFSMKVSEDIVGFYFTPDLVIYVNNDPIILNEGYNDLASGGKIYKYNNNYTVIWPDNSQAQIGVQASFMNIKLYLVSRHQNKVIGILGNYDSDPDNDLIGRDGTFYPSPIGFDTLYKSYGFSWRITNEESLFDYFEEGKLGTEFYTDLNFPVKLSRIEDFSNEERSNAEQLCIGGGVTIDTPILFGNCVLDIAATDGEDLFTDTYRTLTEPTASLTVIPPSTTIIVISPTPNTMLSGNAVFRGIISGFSEIVRFDVVINQEDPIDFINAIDGDEYAFTLSSVELEEGNNKVTIFVEDSKGDISTILHNIIFDSSVAPTESGDIVVINDVNIFNDSQIISGDNIQFVKNLVSFGSNGLLRSTATNIVFDRGRISTCAGRGDCDDIDLFKMRETIINSGFSITNSNSSSGSLNNIDSQTKVIFFWNPEQVFTVVEINTLKQFAKEGGRIIMIGEHDRYYRTGIPIQNKFLKDIGVVMRNIGGLILSGRNSISVNPENEHQVLESIQTIFMAAASEMELGPNDFPLLTDPVSGAVIAAVAKVNINQE